MGVDVCVCVCVCVGRGGEDARSKLITVVMWSERDT